MNYLIVNFLAYIILFGLIVVPAILYLFHILDKSFKTKREEKIQRKIGSVKPIKGLTIYEFDCNTFKLQKALIEEKNNKRAIVKKPDCFYIQALNKDNAVKKLVKKGILEKKA